MLTDFFGKYFITTPIKKSNPNPESSKLGDPAMLLTGLMILATVSKIVY